MKLAMKFGEDYDQSSVQLASLIDSLEKGASCDLEVPETVTRDNLVKAMEDLDLACQVKLAIVDLKPDAEVEADDGVVTVRTQVFLLEEERIEDELIQAAEAVPGVRSVSVRGDRARPFSTT